MVSAAAQAGPSVAVMAAPRNCEQVRNTLKVQRNKQHLSRHALYNLHELAFDSNFIQQIITYPDLSVICYHQDLVSVCLNCLSSAASPTKPTITLTYDTTFNLGDFYVSVLLFRATDFDPSPILPMAYLIHERKFQSTQRQFLQPHSEPHSAARHSHQRSLHHR